MTEGPPRNPGSAGPELAPPAPAVVRKQLRDYVRAHEQRRRLLPRAVAVGLLAGLVAVAFRAALEWLDALRGTIVAAAHAHPLWGFPALVAFAACGAAVAVGLVSAIAPEASGSGIPHVKAVLLGLRPLRAARLLGVKFVGGCTGIGAGLALGREGPTVQMGAAAGELVSRWLATTARERRTLVAAGAGAGLAAAFNAPLAGLVFVLEEIQRDFAPGVFAAALVASATADVTTRVLLGQLPVFHFAQSTIPPLSALPISLLIGVTCGVFGVAFNRTLVWSLDRFQALGNRPRWVYAGAIGAAVGCVTWFVPQAVGGGNGLVLETLQGQVAWWALPFHFSLRFVLTMASYGCGAPGGIFAPLLVLGSEIGLAFGELGHWIAPAVVDFAPTFAVVGMAACFAAIVRAPLTGIVLIVEMTGNYALVLSLLVACLTAYGVADFLGDEPVYEALLERDLLRSESPGRLDETLLLELSIAPGAAFDGKAIRDLGLPPGCILISVRRRLENLVPTAGFRLEAGDRVTAVIAPEAASAIAQLERGVSASGEA